jgi:site-specific DNA-methyltransferase (adenine-specific)
MSRHVAVGSHFEANRIYGLDCLEGMSLLPERSIDLILTDLPYGKTGDAWDTIIDLEHLWRHFKRIIQTKAAIVLTAQCPFDKVLGLSNKAWLKYEWIWEKSRASGFLDAKRAPLKAHENVLVFYKKLPVYHPQFTKGKPYVSIKGERYESNFGKVVGPAVTRDSGFRYPRGVLRLPSEGRPIHPTQKPVALFEYFIRTYTNPGDLVLDACMGSGTTAIACLNTNRQFIGFERDPEYCRAAQERVDRRRAELKSL